MKKLLILLSIISFLNISINQASEGKESKEVKEIAESFEIKNGSETPLIISPIGIPPQPSKKLLKDQSAKLPLSNNYKIFIADKEPYLEGYIKNKKFEFWGEAVKINKNETIVYMEKRIIEKSGKSKLLIIKKGFYKEIQTVPGGPMKLKEIVSVDSI